MINILKDRLGVAQQLITSNPHPKIEIKQRRGSLRTSENDSDRLGPTSQVNFYFEKLKALTQKVPWSEFSSIDESVSNFEDR